MPLSDVELSRSRKVAKWVIDRVPIPLLVQAYELVVSIVLFLIAVPLLGGSIKPESIHAQLPPWLVTTWALALALGALVTVVGLFVKSVPRVELSGQVLEGLALLLYGVAVWREVGFGSGGLAVVIFMALGALGLWRAFKVANRDLIEERLTREAAARLVTRHGGSASPDG